MKVNPLAGTEISLRIKFMFVVVGVLTHVTRVSLVTFISFG
jgi:hypothetical protein